MGDEGRGEFGASPPYSLNTSGSVCKDWPMMWMEKKITRFWNLSAFFPFKGIFTVASNLKCTGSQTKEVYVLIKLVPPLVWRLNNICGSGQDFGLSPFLWPNCSPIKASKLRIQPGTVLRELSLSKALYTAQLSLWGLWMFLNLGAFPVDCG